MKKTVIIIILVGMLGWALFEFIYQPNEQVSEETNEPNEQADQRTETDEAAGQVNEIETEATTDTEISSGEESVGLNVGDTAPDFELHTLDGEVAKLSDYRGERVMLNFWATWCPPCRAEMPDMEQFYQDTGATILAVNLTETEPDIEQVQRFVDEFGITFPVLLDEKIEVAETYAIQPVPTTYMIDSNGKIQFKLFGPMTYDMMVQEFSKMD